MDDDFYRKAVKRRLDELADAERRALAQLLQADLNIDLDTAALTIERLASIQDTEAKLKPSASVERLAYIQDAQGKIKAFRITTYR